MHIIMLFDLLEFIVIRSGQNRPDCDHCKDDPLKPCKYCACNKVLYISVEQDVSGSMGLVWIAVKGTVSGHFKQFLLSNFAQN